MSRLGVVFLFGVLVLPIAAAGGPSKMMLRPGGFGPASYSWWVAHEGQPDPKGRMNDALFFQKRVPSSTTSAAFARVHGLKGKRVRTLTRSLTGLSWDRRNDGHCGLGAPRWNLAIRGATGRLYRVYLGCSAATHSPTSDPAWTRDSYRGDTIAARILAQTASEDALRGTIQTLSIMFDEGIDTPPELLLPPAPGATMTPGTVFLDNIRVANRAWRSRLS